jgi:serine/threonine protein kinase
VVCRVWEEGGQSEGRCTCGGGGVLMGVYQAPEAGNAKRPTQKSDVYSFGVVLLELLTGRSPFKQLAGGELDLVSWMRTGLQGKRALSEIFNPYLLKANNQQNKMIETLQVNWLLVLLALSSFARALHGVEQLLCNVEYMWSSEFFSYL